MHKTSQSLTHSHIKPSKESLADSKIQVQSSDCDDCDKELGLDITSRLGISLPPGLSYRRLHGKPSGIDLPPSTNVVPSNSRTFRFLSLSNNIGSVSVGTLLGALGSIGTVTNSSTVNWNSSIKLHSIKVWPLAGSSAFVEWVTTGGFSKDEIKDSSLPTGVTITKSLMFRPPAQSLASFWNANVGNTLFKIYAPTGSIIDIHVSYTAVGSFTPNTNTVATSAVGSIYYLYLDGSSTKYYQPVALPTTF